MLERQLAVFLFGIDHAGHRPRHADRLVTNLAGARNYVALRVQIQVAGRGGRSHLAIVEKVRLAIRHANQHEPAATNISRRGMHHRQRESRGHRRVHGIAARLHDFHTHMRRQFVHTHHDCVRSVNRERGSCDRRGSAHREQQQNQ